MNAKLFKIGVLDKISKIILKNSTLPILGDVLISNGTITCSDLDIEYTIKHSSLDGIEALVDFATFNKIVSKLKDADITFKNAEDSNSIVIESTKGDFSLGATGHDLKEFPLHAGTFEPIATIQDEHIPLIKKALKYTSSDELRPVMQNILLDASGFIVSTNAVRLCYYHSTPVYTEDILLNPKIPNILNSSATVYMETTEDKLLRFTTEDEVITQLKIKDTFPNWKAVIPGDEHLTSRLAVNSKTLLERLELGQIAAPSKSSFAQFVLSDEVSKIVCIDIDYDNKYTGKLEGSSYTGGTFNIEIINSMLQDVIKTEKVTDLDIRIQGPHHPLIINNCILLMTKPN